MPKLSTIGELARDSILEACRVSMESLQRIKPADDDDGSTKAVLRRMEYAVQQAAECVEEHAQQVGEGTNPLDACAITATGAITGVAAEIARSLIQVKRQRDLLLKVVQKYADAANYDRGRMFKPAIEPEEKATGRAQVWDNGKTARDAIGLIKSTWMPVNETYKDIEEETKAWPERSLAAHNYDELLPPINGGILFTPKDGHSPDCTYRKRHEAMRARTGGEETTEGPITCDCDGRYGCPLLSHIKAVPSKILEY